MVAFDRFKSKVKSHFAKDENKFEWGVLFSKFGLIVTLLTMSYVNADVSYISKKPQGFLNEALLVGGATFVSTAMLSYNRGAELKKILNASFIVFLIFFIFHVLMEFSGMNNSDTNETNHLDDSVQNKLNNTIMNYNIIIPVGLAGLGYMSYLAFKKVNDTTQYKKTGFMKYSIEAILFGLFNASPTLLIAKNRGASNEKMLKGFGMMSLAYTYGFLLLDRGGFFASILNDKSKLE